MAYTIGHKNGRRVRVHYYHFAGCLPAIEVSGGIKGSWRGSLLGPANYLCDPDRSDLLRWQAVVGLPYDETIINRSMGQHVARRRRECEALEAYWNAPAICKCGRETTHRWMEQVGECEACCSPDAPATCKCGQKTTRGWMEQVGECEACAEAACNSAY